MFRYLPDGSVRCCVGWLKSRKFLLDGQFSNIVRIYPEWGHRFGITHLNLAAFQVDFVNAWVFNRFYDDPPPQ